MVRDFVLGKAHSLIAALFHLLMLRLVCSAMAAAQAHDDHSSAQPDQVTADSADDKTSKEEIQMHLHHIARAFKSGDFDLPMFVHDQTPPGMATMKKLKNQIKYKYVSADNGGRVVISSTNAEAVAAVHEFLKFQITEHQTGDALEVK
jgi:hypothetical protein